MKIAAFQQPGIEQLPVEVVERKGIGHPDTLSDGIAESLSMEYSRLTRSKYGAVLHHNVDKLGVKGGHWERDFGMGRMLKPATVVFGGRMSTEFADEQINIEELQATVARDYLLKVMPHLGEYPDHVQFDFGTSNFSVNPTWYKPRNIDDVPDAHHQWANDTSVTVSHFPLSSTEELVKALEGYFYTAPYQPRYSFIGQDIKVMAVRRQEEIDVTVCVPFISTETPDRKFYDEMKEKITAELSELANIVVSEKLRVNVSINTADENRHRKLVYMTATGSCIEFGEEGFVGRGNSPNGLISSMRIHSMEAAFGKNPVYHTGRVHAFFSAEIAKQIFSELGVENSVMIQTNNGDPLLEPQNVLVLSKTMPDHAEIEKVVTEVLGTRNHIDAILNGYLLPKSWQ
jgi:S-adenosylmethionine synthetase